MTTAAERLQNWAKERNWAFPSMGVHSDLCEEVVKVVLNTEHPPFSTLTERLAKALMVELGIGGDDPEMLHFIAQCILARTGLEHVSGVMYRLDEQEGSVLGGGKSVRWMMRFDRKLSKEEWAAYSERSDSTWDEKSETFSIIKSLALMEDICPGIQVVETIWKEQ